MQGETSTKSTIGIQNRHGNSNESFNELFVVRRESLPSYFLKPGLQLFDVHNGRFRLLAQP